MKTLKIFKLPFIVVIYLAFIISCNNGKDTPIITSLSQIEKADKDFNVFLTKNNLMGMAVAAVKDDKLVFSKGYGFANKETNTLATDDSVFLIASISKTITGVAVMQLVEDGVINLDANINTYLPFTVTNPNNPTIPITCRKLMTHTSGISDDYYSTIAQQNFYTFGGSDSPIALANLCQGFFVVGGSYYNVSTFTNNVAGTNYNYSNLGIALLGYIVEKVSNKPFYQYTKDEIFTPLGMTNTSWRLQDFQQSQLAITYNNQNIPYGLFTFADYPNGALRTSVKDLSKFLRAIMLGGSLNNIQILSQVSVNTMLTVQYPNVAGAEGQGLSFYIISEEGAPSVIHWGHEGGELGVITSMYFDPVTKVGSIFFINKDIDATSPTLPELFKLRYSLLQLARQN